MVNKALMKGRGVQAVQPKLLAIYVSFALMLLALPLAWVAKYVWRSKSKTQLFVLMGVVATLTFMILVYDYLP
jgi:CHASE2 domain-containing sensor protein